MFAVKVDDIETVFLLHEVFSNKNVKIAMTLNNHEPVTFSVAIFLPQTMFWKLRFPYNS